MSVDQQRLPDYLALAYQMRNALAHGYFKVDFAIVWRTIKAELPLMHMHIVAARAALSSGTGHG